MCFYKKKIKKYTNYSQQSYKYHIVLMTCLTFATVEIVSNINREYGICGTKKKFASLMIVQYIIQCRDTELSSCVILLIGESLAK